MRYRVYLNSEFYKWWSPRSYKDFPGDKTEAVYDGLLPGSNYEFKVVALNHSGNGIGAESGVAKLQTASGSQTAPGNVKTDNVKDETENLVLELSWDPPAETPEGDEPAGGDSLNAFSASPLASETPTPTETLSTVEYEVAYAELGQDWAEGATLTTQATKASITDLTEGVKYGFRVRAVDPANPEDWSEIHYAVPSAKALLLDEFNDISLVQGSSITLDMADHFAGPQLTYVAKVLVSQTNSNSKEVGKLNEFATDRVTGAWEGSRLTLTAGSPEGQPVEVKIEASSASTGTTASDTFVLTLTEPPAAPTPTPTPEPTPELTPTATPSPTATATPEPTPSPTPQNPAELISDFDDIDLSNGSTVELNMTEHFSGDGLTYAVDVTTTHQRTGAVKTGKLNQVAVNKVTGSWEGSILTLTGGPAKPQELTLEITGTDENGGEASDSFTLALVAEISTPTPTPEPTPAPTPEPTPEPTPAPTPENPADLISDFTDVELSEGETVDLDMAAYFSGDGLTYAVEVTTTHQRTGAVKTGALNSIARNKVSGSWNGSVLTLTGGAAASQELTIKITATDEYGGTASDEFTYTLDNG